MGHHIGKVGLGVACVAAFLWLALDGALHWDEPAYLYTGGYLDLATILKGDFQPSGIKYFYLTRPLHILMIWAVTLVTGPGFVGLVSVIAVCTACLFWFLWLCRRVLGEVMPGVTCLNLAVIVGLLIPVVPYLAFKTLPESGALCFSALAMLSLVHLSKGRSLAWAMLATVSVALTLWLKGPMLLLVGSGVVALLLFGIHDVAAVVPGGVAGDSSATGAKHTNSSFSRLRLIVFTVLCSLAGLGLAYIGVVAVGIDPSIYTGGVSRVGEEYEPLAARVLNNGAEFGLFIIVLPLAFASAHKRGALLMSGWFLVSTVPLALLFASMEARYQSPNVLPLIGLTALAIDGLSPCIASLWERRRVVVTTGFALVMLFVVFSHKLAIAVMQHEVRIGQVQRMLDALDQEYGEDGYALLAAWTYSDFLYLRYVYPDRPIYTAHVVESMNKENLLDDLMRSTHENFLADRMIETPQQLSRIDGRVPVLFGFHENFAAHNLRAIFSRVPGQFLETQLEKMNLSNHLATTWLWEHPGYRLEEVVKIGHYRAYEVRPVLEASAPDGVDADAEPGPAE